MLLKIIVLFFMSQIKCYNLDTFHPLIYRLPNSGEKSSYFGMTVTIRPEASSITDSWIIQVGAPRGNLSHLPVKEPGTIYRCQLYGPCKEFLVDPQGNIPGLNYIYYYKNRRDEAWTGVSMDIKSEAGNTKTVICGSRWSNQNLTNDDNIGLTYLMTGICYLQDIRNISEDGPVYKVLPLVNPGKIYFPKPYVYDKSSYYWGLGQAGISATLLDDLSAVLIGAPGYYNWLGTVIHYSTDLDKNLDFRVGLFEEMFKRNSYPYIGYQVSYGRFFDDKTIWFLVGAPRAENYHGKVIIFQFKDFTSRIHIACELVGSTFGEYFGSSIAVLDINKDGFDDIVVGAPLFSSKQPEEGRIYVYLGANRGTFLFRSQVINGRIGFARFGSCVSGVGDLDQDGYNDIAVGAPYEHSGTGAIYIYRGTKKGLEMEYSQHIAAQDIYPGLLGFGISISRGVDVDGNKYNDVAVGSYLSNSVVLLRSRPVIYLHSVMRLEDNSLLDRKATLFKISICSMYYGSNAPYRASFSRTIEVDANYNRAFLMSDNKSVDTKSFTLVANELKCEILSLALRNGTSNYKPIPISLKSELTECNGDKANPVFIWANNKSFNDSFSKWCPMKRKQETTIDIPFAGECGTDNVCQSELILTCDIPKMKEAASLIVTSELITLSLNLENAGEPALNTYITVHSNIDLIANDYIDGRYEENTKRLFTIDVGTSFTKSFHANFSFRIATETLISNNMEESRQTHLILKIETHSDSIVDFLSHNACDVNFSLLSDSEVNIYSSATDVSTFDIKNTTELNFTLYYEVHKKGDTPVSDAELNICIPSYLDTSEEIEFSKVEVETSDWMYSSVNYEEKKERIAPSEIEFKWHNLISNANSLPPDRTLFLNCSGSSVRCKIISVIFQDGIPSLISSHVKIFITLKLDAIALLLQEKDIIHFTSACFLEYKNLFQFEPIQLVSQSSISFYKEEEVKEVESYIIALSVIAGGLLLFIITTALIKRDFFRRKKKEELEALKIEEFRRQSALEFPPEIIGNVEIESQE